MGLENNAGAGAIRDRLGHTVRNIERYCTGLHTTEHFAEGAVQCTQVALERRFTLVLLMLLRVPQRVPRGVRERTLLREQQEEDVDERYESTLCHGQPGYTRATAFIGTLRYTGRNDATVSMPLDPENVVTALAIEVAGPP